MNPSARAVRRPIARDAPRCFPGIWGVEGDFLFPRAAILEHGHEKRFAGEQPLARAEQRADSAAAPLPAIAEDWFPSGCRPP